MNHESLIDYQCLFFVGFNGKLRGHLDLGYDECCIKIKHMPRHLEIDSILLDSQDEITELPETLIVHGTLDVEGTNIGKLPSTIDVVGNLWMRNTLITHLPRKIKVDGCAYVGGSVGCLNGNINKKHKGVNMINSHLMR